MRAGVGDEANLARRIAKRHQILAQQRDALGLTVGRQLVCRVEGPPVQPHPIAHRRPRPDLAEGFVFLCRYHRAGLRPW
jgi:hypothetical protein